MARYVYGLASAIGIDPAELDRTIRRNVLQGRLQSVVVKTVFQPDIRVREVGRQPYYLALVFNPDHMEPRLCHGWLKQFLESAGLASRVRAQQVSERDQQELEEFLQSGTRNSYTTTMTPDNFAMPGDTEEPDEDEPAVADAAVATWSGSDASPLPYAGPGPGAWDRLLYWISAAGEGSWQDLTNAVRVILEDLVTPMRALSTLRLLGHVELDPVDFSWSIQPAVLTGSGSDGLVLGGARTPTAITELGASLLLDIHEQVAGPFRVLATARPSGEIHMSTQDGLRVVRRHNSRRSENYPSWREWSDGLTGAPPTCGGDCRWQHLDLAAEAWKACDEPSTESGLFRVTLSTGKTRFGCRMADGRWTRGSLIDLRFLARRLAGLPNRAFLSRETRLLIPESCRWPLFFEREIVMGTGRLPLRCVDSGGLVLLSYEIADIELARGLAALLDVEVVERAQNSSSP